MTMTMNDDTVQAERASTRCFVCKLPTELLAALHADRFQNGMGFETIARKYAQPDRPLSESGCRRHFARHVIEPENLSIADGEGVADLGAADGAEDGDELDGHAVLQASTKALTEMMDSLVREHRAVVARNPREAERVLGVFMKAQGQLQRSLKQRDENRARREEFRKTIPHIVQRCSAEAARLIMPVMREHAANLRDEIVEYSHGRLSPEDLWSRLVRYEVEWPKQVGERMRVAQLQALKAEEEAHARGSKRGREA